MPFTKHSRSAWHKYTCQPLAFTLSVVVWNISHYKGLFMQPKLRQLLPSSDAYCQKYNSAWVALTENAVLCQVTGWIQMAARVREELTSLRRWLLLPLPHSSCCRWLSRQSLMSQPWAGLPWKLCSLSAGGHDSTESRAFLWGSLASHWSQVIY